MGPKHYEKETESLQCQLGGTDHSLRLDQNVTKGNRELQGHLGETEIRIGVTELSRVSGSGYVKRTRWRRIDQISGAKFDFGFWTYLEMRKWLRALEHITKHFEQVYH